MCVMVCVCLITGKQTRPNAESHGFSHTSRVWLEKKVGVTLFLKCKKQRFQWKTVITPKAKSYTVTIFLLLICYLFLFMFNCVHTFWPFVYVVYHFLPFLTFSCFKLFSFNSVILLNFNFSLCYFVYLFFILLNIMLFF